MRRTTYQVNRKIEGLGENGEAVTTPILETNDKHEFFGFIDEMVTKVGGDSIVKANSRTYTFQY